MKDGVGIAKSLHQEAARFAQRAVGEFYSNQFIAFIVDAGTAMEHLAKAIVADHAPLHLFRKADRDALTEAERRIICGGTEPVPLWDELGPMIDRISELKTISARSALKLASRKYVPAGIDLDAAQRVSSARNAAVHAGESPDHARVDVIATDWLGVMGAMGTSRYPGELWGNWVDVATPQHLTTRRTLEADADVRLRRAVNTVSGFATDNQRRSRIKLDESNERVTCPACRNVASVTPLLASQFPSYLQPQGLQAESGVLDCLYCGLILYGAQIEHAVRGPGSAQAAATDFGMEPPTVI